MASLTELAEQYHAVVSGDSLFQRRARVLQSLWRDSKGYPMGTHHLKPLGSRLEMPWAEQSLANYLSDTIKQVVTNEVIMPTYEENKYYSLPRIFDDLLSSQPLCFNLFAELQMDIVLASAVFQNLAPGRVDRVTRIEFEHSPGRGDSRYTGDRSAFDVYVEYRTPTGGRGFAGIKVKYHEDMKDKASPHQPRYDEIAGQMRCFRDTQALQRQPLQQLWRDHLLAGSLRLADSFDDGFFALLYPQENLHVANAVAAYRDHLTDERSFAVWTLEQVAATIQQQTSADWIYAFTDRYLDFTKIDAMMG